MDCVHETSLVSPRNKFLVRGVLRSIIREKFVTSKEPQVCSLRASIHGGWRGRLCHPEKQKPPTEKGAQHRLPLPALARLLLPETQTAPFSPPLY